MKFTLCIACALFNLISCCAQLSLSQESNTNSVINKPSLDTSVFGKWTFVDNPAISNNGKYFLYTIRSQRTASKTLVILSIKEGWKREVIGASAAVFTDDNSRAIYINSGDSLCLLTLGSNTETYIPSIGSFDLFKATEDEWLAGKFKTKGKELLLLNLKSNNQLSYKSVLNYGLTKDNNTLFLHTISEKNEVKQQISVLDISNKKLLTIWEGDKAGDFVWDRTGMQLAFLSEDKINGEARKSIWLYRSEKLIAIRVADNLTKGIDNGFEIDGIFSNGFSKDGSKLFIKLKEKKLSQPKTDGVQVNVWSYTDLQLQSKQLKEIDLINQQSFAAVLHIDKRYIFRLQKENEEIVLFFGKANDSICVITSTNGGDDKELNWNSASIPRFFIISTLTGRKKEVEVRYPYRMSPGGKYLIGTDSKYYSLSDNLMCYNIETGQVINLTDGLPIPFNEEEVDGAYSIRHRDLKILRWLEDDESLLVRDKYDIWSIDPNLNRPPVCLTNKYGRLHRISFRPSGTQDFYDIPIKKHTKSLLLCGFNLRTKNQGYFKMSLDGVSNPELISSGPFNEKLFNIIGPLKARDADIYITERQTASTSSNFFWTKDFKKFYQLSWNHPEKRYNWLTSELMNFKTLDGRTEQGVLYKPENFDPKRKYPVIIHFYEIKSDELNTYKQPDATFHNINIPWFVSNGYLIFTPDIHYVLGEPGQSAFNSIQGAANHLARYGWVDSTKIGLQGHSFGGYQTNYIITRSRNFAAAMSSSGMSDFISGYGSLMSLGHSKQYFFEIHQSRIGATFWQRPDLYINNSPVYKADKVTTPLLMMNNRKDGAVPFTQGIELFTALRRLGKKVWMLEYDEGGHTIFAMKDAVQHTLRMTQFFDHYLKGMPAPKWMLYGIPAKDKGIDDGLELVKEKDKNGKWLTPENGGLLTDEEKKKVEALKKRKPITIKLE